MSMIPAVVPVKLTTSASAVASRTLPVALSSISPPFDVTELLSTRSRSLLAVSPAAVSVMAEPAPVVLTLPPVVSVVRLPSSVVTVIVPVADVLSKFAPSMVTRPSCNAPPATVS